MTLLETPALSGGAAVEWDELPPHPKRWSKAEFNDLAERGAFDSARVFLFRGDLIEVPPMGPKHAAGVQWITVWLVRTFDPEFAVRIQLPFELAGESIVLPDGAIVSPAENGRLPQPNRAALVIEIADSSVNLDREKASEYAAVQVPDYWLINLRDREVEVYREPAPDPTSPTSYRYASTRVHQIGESIAPLAKPSAVIAVSALLRLPQSEAGIPIR